MSAHLDHFGLACEPFSKEIPDSELWLPPSKRAVVEEIIEGLEARESLSLTGDPGAGKTCVLRAVRHALPADRFRLTYCHNATLGRRDFYRQLCVALGRAPSATAAAVFYAVSQRVQELSTENAHPVFLLDEAHLLHQDTLDHLHILLNYEWDSKALLSVVLVGLGDLDARLRLGRSRSLYSRLGRRLTIEPLTPEDSAEYLGVRLRRAGCDRDLFPQDAVTLLHEATNGALRDLDRLAATCLRHAARKKRKHIDRDVVTAVLKNTAR
jgi:type II secretory pathway predicted ATPase ExeA